MGFLQGREAGRGRVASLRGAAWVVGLVSTILLLWPSLAAAQSNFEGTPLGGRTTMMGGAAVATGADEATAFMNPAGITRIPGQSFSFSTFAVTFGNRTIKDPLDPSNELGLGNKNVGQLQLRVLPNTFCFFLDGPPKDKYSGRSRHKYAFCAGATEKERLSFTSNGATFNAGEPLTGSSQSTTMDFVRSTMALAWGLELSRQNSLGFTLRVDNASYEDFSAASAYRSGTGINDLRTTTLARDSWSWDTSIVIGFTSNISEVVTLGAALTTPSQHLLGSYTGASAYSSALDGSATLNQDQGDFTYNDPGSLRLGLAFGWPRLTVEVDGSFYGPQAQRGRANIDRTTIADDGSGRVTTSIGRDSLSNRGIPVTNICAGMEWFVERDFSLIGGFATDFSGLAKLQDAPASDVLFRQRKDSIHASFGVSSYGQNGNILLGLRGSLSWGQALIADPTASEAMFVAQSQSQWSVGLVLSGRINFRTVREAAERAAIPLVRGRESESSTKHEKESSEASKGEEP